MGIRFIKLTICFANEQRGFALYNLDCNFNLIIEFIESPNSISNYNFRKLVESTKNLADFVKKEYQEARSQSDN